MLGRPRCLDGRLWLVRAIAPEIASLRTARASQRRRALFEMRHQSPTWRFYDRWQISSGLRVT